MVYTSKRFYERLPFFEVPQHVKIKIYVSFFWLSGIGTVKIKARFDIFYYLSQNFSFLCILGGKGTRGPWNNSQQIVWHNLIHVVNDEVNSGFSFILKLTLEHVHLIPYSAVNVSFAVQVLSSTDVNVLRNYYKEKTHCTAEFCEYMNKFFHCLNVRNQINGVKKRKSFLQPYTNLNDECFK